MSPDRKRQLVNASVACLVASPAVVMLSVAYISHRLDVRFEQERAMIHRVESRHVRMSRQQLNDMQSEMEK